MSELSKKTPYTLSYPQHYLLYHHLSLVQSILTGLSGNRALVRLDGISTLLPDTSLFVYNYVRKEAVLSSQIEGTQSSLSDLLLFESDEMPGVPLDDVQEVSNYVRALDYGLQRVRKEEFSYLFTLA